MAPHLPKKKKKGRQGKQEVLEAGLVTAADRKNPQGPARGPGLFDDMPKKPCPYHQGPDESLQDFIRRFSKKCTELPSVGDSEIIQAFLSGTTCRDVVLELGRNVPTSAAALLDIATNFASGEEAVRAIFPDDDAKGKWRNEAPGASAPHLPKKKKKGC